MRRFIAVIIAVVVIALGLLFWKRSSGGISDSRPSKDASLDASGSASATDASDEKAGTSQVDAAAGGTVAAAGASRDAVPQPDPRIQQQPDGTVWLRDSVKRSKELHGTDLVDDDLQVIDSLLSDYRRVYKENPVGENEEVMSVLKGANPKKIVFIDPGHPSFGNRGELKDRWGTPYVFHALSGTRMDLRSAGPDKELWTKDDVTLGLEEMMNQ